MAIISAHSAAITAASGGRSIRMRCARPGRAPGNTMALPAEIKNWFYGFKPPERGAIVLGHKRVYIVPSRLGLLFGGALLILLIGSINYALALGFALTFLLAGMGLAGMVQTARNLAQLQVSAARVEQIGRASCRERV